MKWCAKLKECLFYLLDNDSEVKQKIADVAGQGAASASAHSEVLAAERDFKRTIDELQAENGALKAENTRLRRDKEDGAAQLAREHLLKAESERAQKALAAQLESAKRSIEKLQDAQDTLQAELRMCQDKLQAARALEEHYDLYKMLPDNLRKSLYGIVNGDSFVQFIISGSQESRQDVFWEFCRTEVQKSNGLAHAETLRKLFMFFFRNLSSISDPKCELYFPPIPGDFKADAMIPSNSGEQAGPVTQVILPGLQGVKTGKIYKKAIVKLGA